MLIRILMTVLTATFLLGTTTKVQAHNKVVVIPLGGDEKAMPVYTLDNDRFGRPIDPPSHSSPAIPFFSSIIVPQVVGKIADLQLTVVIGSDFNDQVDVFLKHVPSDTSLALFTDIGGISRGIAVRLNDAANLDIGVVGGDTLQAVFGEYNLEGNVFLSNFDGLDASGEWQLVIIDDRPGGIAQLITWSLHITEEE